MTSPPYYALRDYGMDAQIGRETTPKEYISRLTEVFTEVRPVELEKAKLHGAGIVAKFQGIDTPEDAAALRGAVALYRKDFPEAEENEYYWVDLIGCEVVNKEGQSIGQVKGMIDNGVHDILNVKRADGKEVLIPFVEDYLAEVNVEAKKIVVDWDPSWD
mgnify:CR=1 FL=1